ncbi:Regulator of sigma-E protease RseP [Aquimixticola soesokkakensis]|uniref:Zinc metalloprotease n=1 Tax=Aquimixticola soesokkakensis TaxID=1519096 RepID=A0A1Y5SIF9_9RHOB|nr:RIP metalloprotease RseP [Aquimixticola soesokkakensis]SLN39874.1 Regulator of sigma-E protease RseP [Aquimixticola soesokkakensis]
MDISSLIPQFGSLIFTLVAFVVALSVIVTIHEYGHYIVGRWCGIGAEVFSVGFGPTLISRTDKRGTVWQIAALPFGGYVKFAGDGDAASKPDSTRTEGLSAAERRRTMAGAPLWARALTVAAGPVFNFILSIAVFAGFMMVQGTASNPLTIAKLDPLPFVNELQAGDEILAIAGLQTPAVENLDGYVASLPQEAQLPYTIQRDGAQMEVTGPHPFPALAKGISPKSAALDAGIEAGDVIMAIDGQDIATFEQMREVVVASQGKALDLTVWRDGETLSKVLEPRRRDLPLPDGGFETRWLIGISGGFFFTPATQSQGLFESLSYGVTQTGDIIATSLSGLWHMITGAISTCNLSGPIGIAETSATMASQGGANFIWFIAMLSTAIGMLNLFPIPVLDGGHLVFFAYEAVVRKPLPERAIRVMMTLGLGLILVMMLAGLGADLFCV